MGIDDAGTQQSGLDRNDNPFGIPLARHHAHLEGFRSQVTPLPNRSVPLAPWLFSLLHSLSFPAHHRASPPSPSYLTLRGLDCRATTALLASLLITFENGMITKSRASSSTRAAQILTCQRISTCEDGRTGRIYAAPDFWAITALRAKEPLETSCDDGEQRRARRNGRNRARAIRAWR
ncbi:hypothetical protein AX14_001479 [Amanita brunnescens Koide BX004]|nr:hypothetical protein AX14_001479 [Amanita brunnescens Koide BX004]